MKYFLLFYILFRYCEVLSHNIGSSNYSRYNTIYTAFEALFSGGEFEYPPKEKLTNNSTPFQKYQKTKLIMD